jgi:hypothetical protein
MKAIFLDIDGVLNCKKTPNPRKFPYVVDAALVARFRHVLDSTGAIVVLSSTWRYDPIGTLAARHFGIPFIDATPDLPGEPRCREILAWLERHPKVERFAVIDDEDDELDDLPLFQPSSSKGLTNQIARGVTSYLCGETDEDMRCNRLQRVIQNLSASFRGHAG